MRCANASQWQWRLCFNICLLNVSNGVVFYLDEQNVRLYRCVCTWIGRCYWWSMQYDAVISSPSITCPHTLQYRWRLRIYLPWLDIWNGCRVGQTDRKFTLLCELELEHVIIGVWFSMLWGRNLTLVRCQNTLRYNGDYGSALIFIGLMYGTVSCRPWIHSAYVALLCVCIY